MKTQKQLQSEQTRQQIIDSAAKLFARNGFHGTSMSDLTSATGLSKGAFYHHFEGKDALFYAVVDSVREKWQNALAQDVLRAENAVEQLAILLNRHARLLRQEPTLCLVITGLSSEMEDDNPSFVSPLHGVYAAMIAFIEEIIRIGQAKQEVRSDVDARLIALGIVGLLRGVSCFGVLSGMGLDCEVVGDLRFIPRTTQDFSAGCASPLLKNRQNTPTGRTYHTTNGQAKESGRRRYDAMECFMNGTNCAKGKAVGFTGGLAATVVMHLVGVGMLLIMGQPAKPAFLY